MNRPVLLIIGFCLFSSFSLHGAETPTTGRDGRIQLVLPDGFTEKTPPKATINLEAINEAEGSTIIVISESQKSFDSLAAYAELIRQMMLDKLKDPQSDAGQKLEVNGNPAIRYEITGISASKLRMGFLLTVIQTDTRFNQVIGSCLRNHFEERKSEFAKISATLKELPAKVKEKKEPEKKSRGKP